MTAAEAGTDSDEFDQYLVLFADRLKVEHDIINQRMTWLMTLNSFLIGGAAVLAANFDKFATKPAVLASAVIFICTVGGLSNASCFYSNCWASVAIRATACALSSLLGNGPHRARALARMRLFGRDPRAFDRPDRFQTSELLHPWMLLPVIFVGIFSLTSGLLAHLTGVTTCWRFLPGVLGTVLLIIGVDAAYRYPRKDA